MREFGDKMTKIKEALANLLDLVPADMPLGTELFNALCRLTITFAFEMVIVREGQGGVPEVYVAQRGPEEAYPGMWHVPGTALRSQETFPDAIARLCAREGLSIDQTDTKVVGILNHRKEERGHFISFIILAEPAGEEMIGGKWMTLAEVKADDKVIPHHRLNIIPRALAIWPGEGLPALEEFSQEDFGIQ